MADPAVKLTQSAAKTLTKVVRTVLGEPNDQTTERPRRLSYMKPCIMYCKIASDYAGGATTISATPCDSMGNLFPDSMASAVDFDLTGHQVEQQCYGNMMAGDIVRYNPYVGSKGGMICAMPIVATSDQYAVMQVGTASSGGTGGRVVFDWVRAH